MDLGATSLTSQQDQAFLAEGLRLIEKGQRRGVPLRLLGAVAVRLHCPTWRHLYEGMDRPITDLDLMALGKHNVAVQDLLGSQGYVADQDVMRFFGSHRHIYEHPDRPGLKVDIFFGALRFCHVVDFTRRLEIDYPTVSLADLVLEKMQIVEINAKDLKDTLVLLCEHAPSETEKPEHVNLGYLCSVLGNDWGYYHTVTTNLVKTREYLAEMTVFGPEPRRIVSERLDEILQALKAAPKTLKWRLREKVGTKAKWYTDVEEVYRP